VAVTAVAIVFWAGWWGFKHVMWLTPAGSNIAQVVDGAVVVNETLLTPPQAYRNVRITKTQMSGLAHSAQLKLAEFYVGDRLTYWRDIARQTLNANELLWGKTTAWMTWWRVDWVHLGELTLLPGSATATVSAEFRSNRDAINRVNYTYHLVPSKAGWRIDREDWEFQPGFGP
jgi:hypothetical protein